MSKYTFTLWGLSALLLILALAALSVGRFYIAPGDVVAALFQQSANDMQHNVIFNLRLPRVIGAILVGAALAVAGTTYQGIFRNPLVSPDLLGVSSGACIGAAFAILLGLGLLAVQGFAFIGGLSAVLLTLALPKLVRRESTIILVLSGIIVSGFMMATLGLMKYLADPETQLADIVYWQLGSLNKVSTDNLYLLAPIIVVTAGLLLQMRWRINVLSLGDREARLIGANVRVERTLMVVLATLLTASSVCLSGTIGWVGLIIPHLARLLFGDNNLHTLPLACLIGAIFLLVIDTLARNIYIQEIPLGILTGFIGAPFFAWVLVKQKVVD
ncbi:FecCD family ABC transporter permease [Glaesserella sp.]|uniref:FecCD family ABC transporter permease n=1 Tax=Glaesserella sp. TaxID=2094731 RepID=UPI0035A09148